MLDSDQQEILLMAIEYLKIKYGYLQNPCIALRISRCYRLLANLNIAKNKQKSYAVHSRLWLACHICNSEYPSKIQNQLNDFVQFWELNSLTL